MISAIQTFGDRPGSHFSWPEKKHIVAYQGLGSFMDHGLGHIRKRCDLLPFQLATTADQQGPSRKPIMTQIAGDIIKRSGSDY